ncbi:MAG: hypothetical protein AB1486_33795 [Planctomycetota bacterium]
MRAFLAIALFVLLSPLSALAQAPLPSALPTETQELIEPTIAISPEYFYPLEEVLYLEGRSYSNAFVTVLLQKQGERPVKFTVKADSSGEWVVAEKTYLSAGNWEVRAKQQVGSSVSGESNPRVIRSIVTGVTIFGMNIRYVVIAAISFAFVIIFVILFVYFRQKIARLERGLIEKRLSEAEERFHRGFAEIRKELMDQLRELATNSAGRPLTSDEIEKRDRVLRELEDLEHNLEHDLGGIQKRT